MKGGNPSPLVHLHLHDWASLRDSIIKHDELVERLREIGQDTVAITNHGTSLSCISAYKAFNAAGIRYIHGCEVYICDDLAIREKANRYYHLVVLCLNEKGRVNLNMLLTKSEHRDNKYYKPRIDFDLLFQHKEGLLIMSACLAGEVSRAFLADDHERAKQIALKYRDAFGDDYFLEVQSHLDAEQIAVNRQIIALGKETGIPCVVTCDAHYVREADRKYQNMYAFNGSYREDGEAYLDCFVQSEDEVRARLHYLAPEIVDELVLNTHRIAERCRVEMPLSAPIMPKIMTPQGYRSNEIWLQAICAEGFQSKLNIDLYNRCLFDPDRFFERRRPAAGQQTAEVELWQFTQGQIDEYIDRFAYELDSLQRMGFIDYILLVWSYANVAKRRGIARGSGGGSLICYAANITNIDPIEHGLYFERFIDVGALAQLEAGEISAKELKIPDIDLDFSAESCKEVLQFLYQTYGESQVASIGKFGTNQAKGTIRDMCKALGYSLCDEDQIAKAFEVYEVQEVDAMIADGTHIPASAQAAVECVRLHPELFDYVRKLNGLPKSFGLHACGKVISTRNLDEFLPSCYDADGVRYLQGDMHDVEDVGLVKIDVLGLRTLDHEYDALELAGLPTSYIDPKQDYSDPAVLDIFRKGDTVGIFQFSSPGMRQTLAKMGVRGINDLSVANALFRPGSMSHIDHFCDRRMGRERFTYLHPDLEPILKDTFGIIVFQEQLIEVGRMAGIRNPDRIRKATGKKDPKLLAEVQPELRTCLIERGWNEEQFDQLWKDMLEFARYSFNKAHSSAYAIIGYMTAKLKAHAPAAFYAGLCNSYLGKSSFVKDDADEIVADMYSHNIQLLPFDWRCDHRKCGVEQGSIRYAIPLIKDCNEHLANELYLSGAIQYPQFWRLLAYLLERKVNKAQILILINLGFFYEYAPPTTLSRLYGLFNQFYGKKLIKRELVEGTPIEPILQQFARCTTRQGALAKNYTITDLDSFMDALEAECFSHPLPEVDFRSRVAYQKQYLGFVSIVTGKEEDRPLLYVKAVYPLKTKSKGRQFGYCVVAQSMGSGKTTRYTVFNAVFNKEPIRPDDVIRCLSYSRQGQYFTMEKYQIEI